MMFKSFQFAWVIARRDFLAAVKSRAFLLFLVTPLLPFAFGELFDNGAGKLKDGRSTVRIVVDGSDAFGNAWIAARERLSAHYPLTKFPFLIRNPEKESDLRLTGSLEHPILEGKAQPDAEALASIALLANEAQLAATGNTQSPAVALKFPTAAPFPTIDIALAAQLGTLILTMLLSGIMLSSLVEERSTKALDVLVSALPVHVVFFGKLLSVLLMALTGLATWILAVLWFATPSLAAIDFTAPAVGWPIFIILWLAYALTAVLLFSAIYLAAGAYAGTPRELQAVAVPLTVLQVMSFALALNGPESPGIALQFGAYLVPWSSPFSMIGFAGKDNSLLPHLAALLWQMGCTYFLIRWSARAFRESVLNGKPLTLIKRMQLARAEERLQK